MGDNSWLWGPFQGERRKYYGVFALMLGALWLGIWGLSGAHPANHNLWVGILALIVGTVFSVRHIIRNGGW